MRQRIRKVDKIWVRFEILKIYCRSKCSILCNLFPSNKLKLTCEVGYDIKATHTCPVEVNKFVQLVSSSRKSKCTMWQSLSKAREERLQ